MDNFSHSLIGLTAGELYLRVCKKEVPASSRLLYLAASVMANNFPDIDSFVPMWREHAVSQLHYHRGHTHTLAFIIPNALFVMAILFLFSVLKKIKWSKYDCWAIALLGVLGGLLHIAADSWNSYGVHPFWPWDNNWYYGDMLFIVEPWLWCTLLPPLWLAAKTKPGKIFYTIFATVTLGLIWFSGYLTVALSAALTVWMGAQFLAKRLGPSLRIKLAITLLSCLLAVFAVVSYRVKNIMWDKFSAVAKVAEVIASPLPANPFCWESMAVTFSADQYQVFLAKVAPLPVLFSKESCQKLAAQPGVAKLETLGLPESENLHWLGKYSLPVSEAKKYYQQNCSVRAMAYFLRAPYFYVQDGKTWIADLRYDRLGRRNFSAFPVGDDCPATNPPWQLPRSDLWLGAGL
jgi:inner membrane protein